MYNVYLEAVQQPKSHLAKYGGILMNYMAELITTSFLYTLFVHTTSMDRNATLKGRGEVRNSFSNQCQL